MNILIPDSWLRDFIKTKAKPEEIARSLSLSSQSVERLIKKNNDVIYDIEVTGNRPDCLSVYGIARELKAILPRFGFSVKFRKIPERLEISQPKKSLPLKVKITDQSLCPRFTALIFDQVTLKPSPQLIQDRLQKSGIRSLNNVVDISNYLMLEVGQPMHTFDYDKIKKATMILRNSKKGEKIITLDCITRTLPDQAIVIEDGQGRLIDLCGIMGGQNSEVDEKTTRVLLFVQTYDPLKIRRTCQALGFRTEAATRFEKGLDEEGVIPAMAQAVKMFKELAGAQIASHLIDIYPKPLRTKKVSLSQTKLEEVLGINFALSEAKKILEDLSFKVKVEKDVLWAIVPHFRYSDISLSEDLIEEVARIYGYHQLPASLPLTSPTKKLEKPPFEWEEKARSMLVDWGFTETINYSMISKNLLRETGFEPKKCLEIDNPLNQELVFMRPSLLPSLLQVVKQNEKLKEPLALFELANIYMTVQEYPAIYCEDELNRNKHSSLGMKPPTLVGGECYLPKGKSKLPEEKMTLSGVLLGNRFYQAKGVVEELLKKLGVKNLDFKPYIGQSLLYHHPRTAMVKTPKRTLGAVGEINPEVLKKLEITRRVVFFELDFKIITTLASLEKTYKPIPSFPPIIEDLAFVVPAKTLVGNLIKEIQKVSPLIYQVKLLDSYRETRTFRLTYQSHQETLTDQKAKKIREKIIKRLDTEFEAKIRS